MEDEFESERVRSPWKGSWDEKAARDEKGLVDGGSVEEAGKHQVVG